MFKKIIKNKILHNFLLATTLAVLIVFGVLWWLKSYTNHGEKIETPNFIGLQLNDAEKLAKEKNVQLVLDSVFYTRAPKGSIYLQNPIPYSDSTPSWVKPNRKIYVTYVRQGVQMLALPDIDASEMIVIPRLIGRFKVKKENIPGPSGKVLKCTYKGKEVKEGDELPRDAELTLFIGQEKDKQPVSLPNLIGSTINEANLKLVDNGLSLVEIYNGCATKIDSANAIIVQQTPEYSEGRKILQGEDIVVILSCAPANE